MPSCNMYPNLCPAPGDQSVNLLGKILSVLNAGGGGGGAGVSSISVNGGPAQTGAVSLTIPGGGSTLLNFTDETANADAVIWTNGGTTEVFRAVGATDDLQFGPTGALNLRGTDGLLTLAGRARFTSTNVLGHALLTSDAVNTTARVALSLTRTLSAGVGAAGLGVVLDWNIDSSTTPETRAARWTTVWTDATHATRNSTSTLFNFVSGVETIQLVLGNNQVAGNLGTVTAPAFTNRNNLGDGMWFPAASTIAWSLAGVERARLNTLGFGIGITPVTKLHVATEGLGNGDLGARFQHAGIMSEGFTVRSRASNGTLAAPSIVASGKILGTWLYQGYDGTTFLTGASITANAVGTIASTRMPGRLRFATATDVAPSVLTDALEINNAQGVTLLAGRLALRIVTLTDAATIATNAAAGNIFRVTLGGNRTLGNPTNPTDGQVARWEFTQDGTGNRTLAFDTQFNFGDDLPGFTLSTAAGARDYIVAVYNAANTVWDVLSGSHGF